jgi:hypothetical protein
LRWKLTALWFASAKNCGGIWLGQKNRVKGFLDYLGITLPEQFDNANWSHNFIRWLEQLSFTHPANRRALDYQIREVVMLRKELLSISNDIRKLMRSKKYKDLYYLLRTVTGIGPLTAAALLTEIGDMKRFSSFYHLNSFVGLMPMEHSSGEKEMKGRITVRKHRQLRSELVECAWTAKRNDPALALYYSEHRYFGECIPMYSRQRLPLVRERISWIKLIVFLFAKRLSFKLDFMSVCCQPVTDCIGERWLIYVLIPFSNWQLRSDDRGPYQKAVFQDLKQGKLHIMRKRLQSKIVKDKKRGFLDLVEPFNIASIQAGLGQGFHKTVHRVIQTPLSQHTGLASQGARKKTFA